LAACCFVIFSPFAFARPLARRFVGGRLTQPVVSAIKKFKNEFNNFFLLWSRAFACGGLPFSRGALSLLHPTLN